MGIETIGAVLDNLRKTYVPDKRITSGLLWNLLATVAGRLAGLLVSVILSRALGKEGFGEYSIVQSTVLTFGVLAGFGAGLTATKHIAETFRSDPERAGRILGMADLLALAFGGLMALVLLFSASLIATHILASPQVTVFLQIASVSLVASAWSGVQSGALAGFEAFQGLSKVNLYSGIFTVAAVAAGVMWNGTVGALWGFNSAAVLTCVLGARMLRMTAREKGVAPDYRNCLSEWPVLWRFSLPTMLANALVTPAFWICNAMLVNQAHGYAELAVYNVATQWRQLVLFLPGIAGQVLLPVLSSQSPAERQQTVRGQYLLLNMIIAAPFVVGLSVVSPLVLALYGSDFTSSWPVFVIVQAASFLQILQSPMIASWAAEGRMWTNFTANVVWSACLVLVSWTLIEMGALGLAIALLASFLLYFPVIHFAARRSG